MAELFLARDPSRDELIVIKRILPYLSTEPEFVQMFLDEARIAAQLNHPNVVQVHELGRLDQSIFLSMEFVDGIDLRKILQEEMKSGMAVPHAVAAWITARVCDGLHHAHNGVGIDGRPLELIHRDVSPQNVMVGYDGRIKIVDFGIAKANAFMERSKPGVIKGKFLYLSPEQLSQDRVDHRADLFAVGTMLYEVTTGKSPFFKTTTEAVILAIRSENPPPPHLIIRDYPPELSRIIMKCLTKDRSRRYQQASEIAADLDQFSRAHARADQGFVSRYVATLFGDESDRTVLHIPSEPDPLLAEVRASLGKAAPSRATGGSTAAAPRTPSPRTSAGRRITSEQPVVTLSPTYDAEEPPTRGARPSTIAVPAPTHPAGDEDTGATLSTTGLDEPGTDSHGAAHASAFADDGPVFDTLPPVRASEDVDAGPEPKTRPESPRASMRMGVAAPRARSPQGTDDRTDEYLGDAEDDASTSTFAALAARSRAASMRRLAGSRKIILASIVAAVVIIVLAGVARALRDRSSDADGSPSRDRLVGPTVDDEASPAPERLEAAPEQRVPEKEAPDAQTQAPSPETIGTAANRETAPTAPEQIPMIIKAPTGTRLSVGRMRLAPEKTYRFEPGVVRVSYRCPGRKAPTGTRQVSLEEGSARPLVVSISCRRK